MSKVGWAAVVGALLLGPAPAAEKLTYVDLIQRLTDLERLAVRPSPGERCAQWSSYDRASRYDPQTGKYLDWEANGDGGGVIREEGGAWVVAEMEGPGCIWRIWSAAPGPGHVRIYLDGAAEPAVDLPFSGYFDLQNPPFIYPSLVHEASSGKNCYVPIPYQKSCKITADREWGNYYQFTYETFPPGTVVPTFRRQLAPEETAALEKVDRFLREGLGTDPAGPRPGEVTVAETLTIPPGETAVVASLAGPRAITALRVKMDLPTREEACQALRELVLRLSWDGEATPSVWAPLGDFFGTAPGVNPYRSLPLGMTEEGFYSFWYMPFARSAVVELANEGAAERSLEVAVTHAPLSRPVEAFGRFHAKWHRDAFLPAEPERWIDWTLLQTQGAGRYCGVMLHVWNPRGGWWGEGDEKFFVDGEKFPSTIGTGSEDYFGYAWGNPTLFQNAYHNQTFNSGGNKGHISVNRWHIPDNVPFHASFEGAIEKYYPNDRPTLYACTVYWYLSPDGTDPYGPVPVAERTGYYALEPPIFRVAGALEGESLKVLEKTGGNVQTQEMQVFGEGWSGEAHLWWTGGKPGDTLTLALPVPEAGSYALKLQLTKARDYGIVQLSLDGNPLGEALDLYDPAVVPTGELSLGVHALTAGEHRLTLKILGANDQAVKAYMAGVDYVKLEKP